MSIGCQTMHRWCNAADNPLLQLSYNFVWKKGEPSVEPMKECVAVEFQREYPFFSFFKVECTEILGIFTEEKSVFKN